MFLTFRLPVWSSANHRDLVGATVFSIREGVCLLVVNEFRSDEASLSHIGGSCSGCRAVESVVGTVEGVPDDESLSLGPAS